MFEMSKLTEVERHFGAGGPALRGEGALVRSANAARKRRSGVNQLKRINRRGLNGSIAAHTFFHAYQIRLLQ
jgi:hypothetical protein